jgi:mono/diheme cytochrome c family protein
MRSRSITVLLTILLVSFAGGGLRAFGAEEGNAAERRQFVEGARLWPVYCAQCHNARPGSQFSPAQWEAITMHMKTLSNMPAKDMRAIKQFLEEAR